MPPLFPGSGAIKAIVSGAIAPGVNAGLVVPTHARWELLAARVVLSTDVTVVNRRVILHCFGQGLVHFRPSSNLEQAASLAYQYWFSIYPQDRGAPENAHICVPLPHKIIIRDTASVWTDVHSLQAGDQITDFRLLVNEWIEPE